MSTGEQLWTTSREIKRQKVLAVNKILLSGTTGDDGEKTGWKEKMKLHDSGSFGTSTLTVWIM